MITECLPIDQVGFRPNPNCEDQVLPLITFVGPGHEQSLKTADLIAPYDCMERKFNAFLSWTTCCQIESGKPQCVTHSVYQNSLVMVSLKDQCVRHCCSTSTPPQSNTAICLLLNKLSSKTLPNISGNGDDTSVPKTETSCFHLKNRFAPTAVQVSLNEAKLSHNSHPKYLAPTLDRTVSYRRRLAKLGATMKFPTRLLIKLTN